MSKESEIIFNDYIKEIKKALPEWIKNNDEKLEDIITELSSHVWDSACEHANSDEPDAVSMQKAILNMGSPKEIANSYKSRGTPKFFISEELWPYYLKVAFGLTIFIFSVIFILQVVLIEPRNFVQAVVNSVTISYGSVAGFMAMITILFVYFSKEGFLPEDFEEMDKKNKKDKKEKKFVYYKPGEHFFGGIFSFIFGLFFILLPIDMLNLFRILFNFIISIFSLGDPINEYVSISPDLRIWVTLMGTVSIIGGIISVMRINSRDPKYHIQLNMFTLLTKFADIALTVYILINLHLFLEILPLSETILLFLGALGIIGAISEILGKINESVKLFGLLEDKNVSNFV